jgi:hypothetical protein
MAGPSVSESGAEYRTAPEPGRRGGCYSTVTVLARFRG